MEITVNNLGFCSGEHLPFIYSFVHALDSPYFTHFDNSSNVSLKETGFEKRYHHNTISISTEQCVDVADNTLHWSMSPDPKFIGEICYGISIKVDSFWPEDYKNNKITRITNYFDNFYRRWEEQSYLDIPIVLVRSNDQYFAISTPIEKQSQFFYYKDGDSWYIKISTKSNKFTCNITPISNMNNLSDLYKQIYPDAIQIVDFYPICFKKVLNHYGAQVIYNTPVPQQGFSPSRSSEEEVVEYSKMFWQEMLVYRKMIFEFLDTKSIYLCSDPNSSVSGFCRDDFVVYNISSKIGELEKRYTIHHEIFHLLQKKQQVEYNEDEAMIYAFYIIDRDYLNGLLSSQSKYATVYNKVLNIIRQFNILINEPLTVSTPTAMPGNSNMKSLYKLKEMASNHEKLMSHNFKPKIKSKEFMVCGMHGSGISLFRKISNINIEAVDKNNVEQIIYHHTDKTIITLVRNPIDVISRAFLKDRRSINSSFEEWNYVHKKLAESQCCFIRYEDIVSFNRSKISKLLGQFDIPWTFKQEEINPDRIRYNLEMVPGIRPIWDEFRKSSLAVYFEYANLQLGI